MTKNELDKAVEEELLLKEVTQVVADYLKKMNYLGIEFVRHPAQAHIGVQIIPMPQQAKILTSQPRIII